MYPIKGVISANDERGKGEKTERARGGNVPSDVVRRVNKRAHLPSNYEIVNKHAGWWVQKNVEYF